jgi:hypothetical protein
MFYDFKLTNKNSLVCRSDNSVVLCVAGQGHTTHEGMKRPSHELRLVCKWIWSSDIELTIVYLEKVTESFTCLESRSGGDVPFVLIASISKKVLTYKTNLHSIANIAGSNTPKGLDVYSYECCVFSGTHLCDR